MELKVGKYGNSKGSIVIIDEIEEIDNRGIVHFRYSEHDRSRIRLYDILLTQMEFLDYKPIEYEWD